MEEFALVTEQARLPYQSHCLREDCGEGGSAYSHVEGVDEQRVEHRVEHHGEYRSVHGLPRFACRPQHSVHTEIQVGDDVAEQYYHHIFACVRDCLLARPEEIEYGIEE